MLGRSPSVPRGLALVVVTAIGCATHGTPRPAAPAAASSAAPAKAQSAPNPVDSPALAILNAAGSNSEDPPSSDQPQGSPTPEPEASRGWLGVELARAPGDRAGVLVRTVMRGSPAEKAGLKAGDVLTTVDGHAVRGAADVVRIVTSHVAGDEVPVAFTRNNAPRLLRVALAALPDQDDMMRMQFAGQRAPEFIKLSPVQGSFAPSIGALKGKVVLIEFWASWCIPCRVLAPKIEDLYQRYSAQGVAVLAVTTDPVSQASQAANQIGIRYPVASDESGETTEAYRAMALPTVFVIDRQGVVRDVMVGYSTRRMDEVGALLERLLAP